MRWLSFPKKQAAPLISERPVLLSYTKTPSESLVICTNTEKFRPIRLKTPISLDRREKKEYNEDE